MILYNLQLRARARKFLEIQLTARSLLRLDGGSDDLLLLDSLYRELLGQLLLLKHLLVDRVQLVLRANNLLMV